MHVWAIEYFDLYFSKKKEFISYRSFDAVLTHFNNPVTSLNNLSMRAEKKEAIYTCED